MVQGMCFVSIVSNVIISRMNTACPPRNGFRRLVIPNCRALKARQGGLADTQGLVRTVLRYDERPGSRTSDRSLCSHLSVTICLTCSDVQKCLALDVDSAVLLRLSFGSACVGESMLRMEKLCVPDSRDKAARQILISLYITIKDRCAIRKFPFATSIMQEYMGSLLDLQRNISGISCFRY